MCISRQRGISLIELIMFIVIVSFALAGILLVMNNTTSRSADTLIRKQELAIAESLLEEAELMPFTYCDPDDANATTAPNQAGCATTPEGVGPETIGGVTEIRNDGLNNNTINYYFDNVSDYNGFSMTGAAMKDITGTALAPLSGYMAAVAVAQQGMPAAGTTPAIANTEALLVTVTVSGPDGTSVSLDGYRTRYAPNSVP